MAVRAAVYAAVVQRLTATAGQQPDRKRVSAVIDSLGAERLYWSRLERPFREFMVALVDTGPEQRDARAGEWLRSTLRPAAVAAFEDSVGRLDGGRMYRAANAGRVVLHARLGRLDPAPTTEVTHG